MDVGRYLIIFVGAVALLWAPPAGARETGKKKVQRLRKPPPPHSARRYKQIRHRTARRKPVKLARRAARKAKRRVTRPGGAASLNALQRYLLSAPVEKLAGKQKVLLRSSKIDELMSAARRGELSEHDVATFSQSVHPALLRTFERGARLPEGYFLTVTRQAQFPGGNPFLSTAPPSPAQVNKLRQGLQAHLMTMVRAHRAAGGKLTPRAVQLLTSTSHLVAPKSPAGDAAAVKAAVEAIPLLELARRHAYITRLKPAAVFKAMPNRAALSRQKDLVNFDHLLGALGKVKDGKLLIEIYAENMPADGKVGRFLPVTAMGEGSYCVDDIARTTVALLQSHRRRADPLKLKRARQGLAFVSMMQAPDGEFFNFASLQGSGKLKVNRDGATSKKGIDFWAGRALWAMGEGYASLRKKDPAAAGALLTGLKRTLGRLEKDLAARRGTYHLMGGKKLPGWLINDGADQTAVALKGLLAFYRAVPRGKLRTRLRAVISRYADGIAAAQVTDRRAPDHGRFLHSMKDPSAVHLWGSRQVEVLAEAGKLLGKRRWIRAAARCADHYWGKRTPTSIASPGEEQIAYGVEAVVSGYARLFEATGSKRHARATARGASWLLGNNDAGALVYDPLSGRGYDGIRQVKQSGAVRYSANSNAGAESTVEAILALQSAARVPGVHRKLRADLMARLPR